MTTERVDFPKAPPDEQFATSANSIPVSSRKSRLSVSTTSYGTSANSIPVSSRKSQLSVSSTFHATSISNTLYATSANTIPIKSNNSVKVNHTASNSGDVKPFLSADSKSSARRYDNPSYESIPLIVSTLVGKFINDQKQETIIVEDFEWRRLHEQQVDPMTGIYFNLNHNFETFEHNPLYDGKIDPILKYIVKTAKEGTNLRDAVHGCELVTNRRVLVKIATFNTLDNFYDAKLYCQVVFQKFNGVIFACEIFTEEDRLSELNASRKQKLYTYYGHKFEQCMTTEFANDISNLDEPVSTLSQQYGVFKAQIMDLNDRRLPVFLTAEVDGLDEDGNFVEFKIANQRNPMHRRMNWDNTNKSKWWAQSALSNVKYVLVGMHKGNGIVTKVLQLHIPRKRNTLTKEGRKWSREECVDLLLNFIDEVRELLNSKPDGALLKVDFFVEPQKEIKSTWISDDERDKYEFLLPEFTERFSPK